MERADKQASLIGDNLAAMPPRDIVLAMVRCSSRPAKNTSATSALNEGATTTERARYLQCRDLNRPNNISVRPVYPLSHPSSIG